MASESNIPKEVSKDVRPEGAVGEESSGRDSLLEDLSTTEDFSPGNSGRTAESLPELTIVDAGDDPEKAVTKVAETVTEDESGPKLEANPDFEFKRSHRKLPIEGTEDLGEIIDGVAREYLGEDYSTFSKDPSLMYSYARAFRRALVDINGLSADESLSGRKELIMPGVSQSNDFLFQAEGKHTYWSLDDSTTVRDDGTGVIRTDYPDGRYQIINPDNSREELDPFGVIQKTRQLEDGIWLTEGSDGTYRRVDTRDNTMESRDTDGLVTRVDNDGNSKIFDQDGKLIGEGFFSGQYTLKYETTDDGIVNTLYSGSRGEFRLTLTELKDGGLRVREEGSETDLEFVDSPPFDKLSDSREKLLALVDDSVDSPLMKAKFKADMIRFENRARESGLSADSVENSYKALSRLLDKNVDGVIDERGREQLAGEVVSNLAKPYTVSQGQHGTCNVKILDVLLNAKHPDKVANMISEVATTGKYTLPSGEAVNVPAGTLKPAQDASHHPRWNGERGFAGQIFDSTVINAHLQSNNMSFRFDQVPITDEIKSGDVYVDNKTDEVLTGVDGKPAEFKGLYVSQIVEAYRLVMGNNDSSRDWILDPISDTGPTDGIRRYNSPEELGEILTALKEEGAFPYPIHVNVKMPPFWRDSGAGWVGGSSGPGNHVLNITDYDPGTGKVSIDNQWSTYNDRNTADRAVPLQQVYNASLSSGMLESQLFRQADASFEGKSPIDFARHRLEVFNQAIEGGDPEYLSGSYDELVRTFARTMRDTRPGEAGSLEAYNLYNKLTPEGKLTVLEEMTAGGQVSEAFTEADFNKDFISMAEYYGVAPLDFSRGLASKPTNLEDARKAGLDGNTRNNVTYLKGKLALVQILNGLPEAHRSRLLDQNLIAYEALQDRIRQSMLAGAE